MNVRFLSNFSGQYYLFLRGTNEHFQTRKLINIYNQSFKYENTKYEYSLNFISVMTQCPVWHLAILCNIIYANYEPLFATNFRINIYLRILNCLLFMETFSPKKGLYNYIAISNENDIVYVENFTLKDPLLVCFFMDQLDFHSRPKVSLSKNIQPSSKAKQTVLGNSNLRQLIQQHLQLKE